MFYVLIDSSVWLDMAVDKKQSALIHILGNMATDGDMELLVPRLVLTEFERNRERISKQLQQSVSSQFGVVKDAIGRTQINTEEKAKLLEYLSDQSHLTPLIGGVVEDRLEYIELLLKGAAVIEATDEVKLLAAERAIKKQAPCHRDRNSMADAILIETYFECVRDSTPGNRFAFVTHNKKDFSDIGERWESPHPDIASGFSQRKSLYFTNLSRCLQRINPERVEEISWEMNYEEQIRPLSVILEATERLTQQVWHNRHKNREWEVEQGNLKVIPDKEWHKENYVGKGYNDSVIEASAWEAAVNAAKETEKMLGEGNHGPWSDFEWGMINGKLSALRWLLGEEWDMLDT